MELANKGVLVTGGASGLGAACVRLLATQGANVVIADLDNDRGQHLSTELNENGAQTIYVPTDVTSEDAVQSLVQTAIAHFRGLHIVINCAGVGLAEKVTSKRGVHSLASFQKVIAVNLIGTFNVIRLAVTAMAENQPTASGERGVIINTASIAAFDGQIGQAAYAASKGGIVSLTLPLAREFAALGIRVMTIAPGIFDTPLLGALPEAARQSLGQQVPFPSRLGQPAEYAALARHIIENEMLNGTTIRLDGGLRMAPR